MQLAGPGVWGPPRDALCLLAVLVSIAPWKPKISKLPLESFFESVISAIRYVRYSHGIRIILIRNAIFSFFMPSFLRCSRWSV